MCSQSRECHIESKAVIDKLMYECKSCKKRAEPDYYIKNNLHPVWYLVDDDSSYILDKNGGKVVQYHIPDKLACLTMYEKSLIRCCANFIPSVHLKHGIFGLNDHCVTFPQDISKICEVLPLQK